MSTMFNFNPETCAEAFAENGFIHIDNGLREEFHHDLVKYIENSFNDKHLKDFARGDKQQALFEFLEPDHYEELRHAVAKVCGVEPGSLTLSERHIKQYEVDADPYPLAHKDRFGSEFAVGFSIIVPEGSTLVIYPEGDLTANPFNSTAELRSSFSPDDLPEPALKRARRVEIQDRPGDVQIFRGSAMWHLREHGAGTTVLYLKLNTFNCDTLAEDPHTPALRQQTLSRANSITSEWDTLIPVVARRVDYIHRRYSRDWSDLYGVVLYGQSHVTITEPEFLLLRALDGQQTVSEVCLLMQCSRGIGDPSEAIRRLAQRGIVDLVTAPLAMGGTSPSRALAQVS